MTANPLHPRGHGSSLASRSGQGSPARQHGLRRHNLALVLQHIAANGPVSRARIAQATSLTKATVSSLVDDLVAARLVTELGPEARGEIGRPGSALALDRTGFVGGDVLQHQRQVVDAQRLLAGGRPAGVHLAGGHGDGTGVTGCRRPSIAPSRAAA